MQTENNIPSEDAWAYTPEHRKLLAKALDDVAHGRVRKLSEDELRDLAQAADAGRFAEALHTMPGVKHVA